MTLHFRTSDDPEQIEYDTRDGEIARRNILFGLWVGQRMGLKGDAIEAYAWSVHLVDRDSPGHDDVIAKVAIDLASCGRPVGDRQLRSYLREMEMRASLDLAQTYPEAIMSERG